MASLFMCENFFNEILTKVTEVTGVSESELLSSNKESATDARYILVRALYKLGYTDTEVSVFIHRSRQSVGYLRNNYKKSNKWILSNHLQTVCKWIEDEYLNRK